MSVDVVCVLLECFVSVDVVCVLLECFGSFVPLYVAIVVPSYIVLFQTVPFMLSVQ